MSDSEEAQNANPGGSDRPWANIENRRVLHHQRNHMHYHYYDTGPNNNVDDFDHIPLEGYVEHNYYTDFELYVVEEYTNRGRYRIFSRNFPSGFMVGGRMVVLDLEVDLDIHILRHDEDPRDDMMFLDIDLDLRVLEGDVESNNNDTNEHVRTQVNQQDDNNLD